MFCAKCDTQSPEGATFCSSCGQSLAPAATAQAKPACPQCGSEVSPGQQSCAKCGSRVDNGGGTQASTQEAAHRTHRISAGIAAVGAIMMLVSLAVPWYQVQAMSWFGAFPIQSMSALDFVGQRGIMLENVDINWAGSGLPIVVLVIVASVILLSAMASVATGEGWQRLWRYLSLVGLISVIVQGSYFYYWWWTNILEGLPEWAPRPFPFPHIGLVLAFIGVLIVVGSAWVRPRPPRSTL